MTTGNFCFYLQSRLIQTSQIGGQWYSDPLVFPVLSVVAPSSLICLVVVGNEEKKFYNADDVAGAGTTGSFKTETNRLGPGTKFCS